MVRFSSKAIATALILSVATPITTVSAQTIFSAPIRDEASDVSFAGPERGTPILAGGEVIASGKGFKAGQAVTLNYGTSELVAAQADGEGKFEVRFKLPTDAVSGVHNIMVLTQVPYQAKITELKVSPTVPLAGQNGFTVQKGAAAPGLYQTAFSARSNAIFATSAVGRPPVRQSELLRLNPSTLAVEARVTPAAAPARQGRDGQPQEGGVYAVYGVGVDDQNGNVWVTNTRQNTVAIYRQADLALVHQFAPGTVNHPRDVVIDPSVGKAFVSATFEPEVFVFNTAAATEAPQRIAISTRARGKRFSAASLSFNAAAKRLYVVSNSTNEVAVINTQTQAVENVFAVPGARAAIGVSHDPQTGRIYVAAQGTDNLIILDGTNGSVIADTPVGAGALNVVFDPTTRRAYVANRGASSVTVTDADGRITANLGPAPMVNHVSTDGRGNIFAVTKGQEGQEAGHSVIRIRARK